MSHWGTLIVFFLPVILGGIANMVFMKLPVMRWARVPMDGGRILADGRRLLGDNKSWKGFAGMVVLTTVFSWLQELLAAAVPALQTSQVTGVEGPGIWLLGPLMGFGYALAELPNSFVKRRLAIPPGGNVSGPVGLTCAFVDQADSVVGVLLAVAPLVHFGLGDYLFLFAFGTGLHYVLNVLLFFAGLRKQAA